jgi:putative ABC transport system permease protein
MILKTRWHKILNDIKGNKSRSLLVVLSIAVGIGVVGIINNAKAMIEDDLFTQYEQGNPASVNLYTSPFTEPLVDRLLEDQQVERAEGRRLTPIRIIDAEDGVHETTLVTVADFNRVSVNQLTLEDGSWALEDDQIALEKQSVEALGASVGDVLTIEMEDGSQHRLTVSAIMMNIYEMPYKITNQMTAFVSMDTLEALGETPYFNRLDLQITDHNGDADYVIEVAAELRDEVLLPSGVYVGSIQIPGIESDPGEHWAQNQISGFVLILQVMSVMAIFLSGGLVINTITAILTQQVKQIGIMRSIGAIPSQITGMFVFNVLVFSFIGWLLAIPISLFGSYGLAAFAASFLNYTVSAPRIAPDIFALITALAFIIPAAVALYPILAGTRIKIYDAIYQQGLVKQDQKPWLERLLIRLKFLNPASVLSILNTFRNIPRLSITLITLALAGATFVAAFSTRASLNAQIEEFFIYAQYDASIEVETTAPIEEVLAEARAIPGVVYAEGWAQSRGTILNPDGTESSEVELVGLSPDSKTVEPILERGRWLANEDLRQVVINDDLASLDNKINVGNQITLSVMGTEESFEVVGIVSKHLVGPRIYLNYPAFTELIGVEGQVNTVRVRANDGNISNPEDQEIIAAGLEEHFDDLGFSAGSAQTQASITEFFTDPFNIILMVLVIMAGLLAVVGGLSLAGTMGINVMERTREIGVLRSVGASNGAIRQVVALEGVMIAFISWLIVGIVSSPFSAALAGAVILAVLNTSLTFSYSFGGLFLWLGIIVVIGVVSSLSPARSAVLLTVREVLDYE